MAISDKSAESNDDEAQDESSRRKTANQKLVDRFSVATSGYHVFKECQVDFPENCLIQKKLQNPFDEFTIIIARANNNPPPPTPNPAPLPLTD